MTHIEPLSLQTNAQMIAAHASLVQDFNPLHLDADFAAATAFGAPIVHGSLMLNLLTEAIERSYPQLIVKSRIAVRFAAPVLVGDTITAGGASVEGRNGAFDVWVTRSDGTKVVTGTLTPVQAERRRKGTR